LKKITTRLVKIVTPLLAVVLLSQLSLFVAYFRTRQKAESLLASLRKAEVGTTTSEEMQPLLAAYEAEKIPPSGGCASGEVAYGILVSNHTIDYLGTTHPFLLNVGVRPLSATAVLSFAGGRLCDFSYSTAALLLRRQYPLRITGQGAAQLIEINAQTTVQRASGGENYQVRSFQTLLRGFRQSGVDLGVRVVVTPDATPSEFEKALTFDLSCFTSLRGCRTLSQLMPLVPQDALQTQEFPY